MMLMQRFRRPQATGPATGLLRDRRGGPALDMALISWPLLMLIFGIMELGRALWLSSALHYSVQDAARCAAINSGTCGTTSAIQTYAANHSGAGFGTATFSVTTLACGKQVTASYPMTLMIPWGNYTINLYAKSCFPD